MKAEVDVGGRRRRGGDVGDDCGDGHLLLARQSVTMTELLQRGDSVKGARSGRFAESTQTRTERGEEVRCEGTVAARRKARDVADRFRDYGPLAAVDDKKACVHHSF